MFSSVWARRCYPKRQYVSVYVPVRACGCKNKRIVNAIFRLLLLGKYLSVYSSSVAIIPKSKTDMIKPRLCSAPIWVKTKSYIFLPMLWCRFIWNNIGFPFLFQYKCWWKQKKLPFFISKFTTLNEFYPFFSIEV